MGVKLLKCHELRSVLFYYILEAIIEATDTLTYVTSRTASDNTSFDDLKIAAAHINDPVSGDV
jgi:hypothetical protein